MVVTGEEMDQMTGEWQPSKKDYLQVEQEVIKLMFKVHEQDRQISRLAVLCALMLAYLTTSYFFK